MTMEHEQKSEFEKIQQLEVEALDAIFKGQKKKVVSLFGKAEQLFQKGSSYTRTIISNTFILPLSQLLEMNYSWGKEYLILFPKQLKQEYCRQIYSSGI
ncbi:hypothetical protein Pedsa_1582 [Pseudopedobacter saltans DSM 12145]|uniref:DUF7674 domain-containing protein n=2 Tax=Bacteroidota/Chlorobiota group TaxID=68336 RepID=F0S638_PSESL|nr:hypothetical protein Pedsa_1582 [Pseudopedobacter saltans DSM 12145]